jgi:hypothetical protein
MGVTQQALGGIHSNLSVSVGVKQLLKPIADLDKVQQCIHITVAGLFF